MLVFALNFFPRSVFLYSSFFWGGGARMKATKTVSNHQTRAGEKSCTRDEVRLVKRPRCVCSGVAKAGRRVKGANDRRILTELTHHLTCTPFGR